MWNFPLCVPREIKRQTAVKRNMYKSTTLDCILWWGKNTDLYRKKLFFRFTCSKFQISSGNVNSVMHICYRLDLMISTNSHCRTSPQEEHFTEISGLQWIQPIIFITVSKSKSTTENDLWSSFKTRNWTRCSLSHFKIFV